MDIMFRCCILWQNLLHFLYIRMKYCSFIRPSTSPACRLVHGDNAWMYITQCMVVLACDQQRGTAYGGGQASLVLTLHSIQG